MAQYDSESWQAAAERATGMTWHAWVEFLDPLKELPHKEMALRVVERMEAPDVHPAPETNIHWWGQSVTVAYEQHIGRRAVGERCDGSFAASVSKTVNVDLDELNAAWQAWASSNLPGVGDAVFESEPRLTQSAKWRYWRSNLSDGSAVSINFSEKQPGKSVIAADHSKLGSQDAATDAKANWRAIFGGFVGSLAS